jgi:hypothetical protein
MQATNEPDGCTDSSDPATSAGNTKQSAAEHSAAGSSPKQLVGHPALTFLPIPTWACLVIGPIALLLVVATFGVARNADSVMARWVSLGFTIVFGLLGSTLLSAGARRAVRTLRRRRLRRAYPDQPWRWDFEWERDGIADNSPQRIARALFVALFVSGILLPFNAVALYWEGEKAWVLWCFVGIFDLVGFFLVLQPLALLANRLKFGRGRIAFDRLPYALGERLCASFALRAFDGSLTGLRATLRCIEERWVSSGTGSNRRTSSACLELYSAEQILDAGAQRGARGWTIGFQVPSDLGPTRLSAHPKRYWQLEIEASTEGPTYTSMFLLPIYESAAPNAGPGVS